MGAKARILIVDDDPAIRESLDELLQSAGFDTAVASDGEAALSMMKQEPVDLVLSDGQMHPMDGYELLRRIRQDAVDIPVMLMSAYGTVDKAVEAMRHRASHYLVKPFSGNQLVEEIGQLLNTASNDDGLVAADQRTLALKALAARVAATDATVLISGPSGVGKEVFARFIHRRSSRASGPFVAVNCAAIPENMLEAMLFGYEKGAYTGAVASHEGKFEQAQHGTLLLDEISEMDLGLQAKLLRVLQERELERLGGKRTITLDVRVIATTNRDLRAAVRNGEFREDLFYRLNVFPLHIHPLGERPADILPLAEYFLARNGGEARRLSAGARERLQAHRWPGNVRELDNVIQRALILATGSEIRAEDIHFEADADFGVAEAPADGEASLSDSMREQERRLIADALKAGGSKKEAAAILGISPRTLRYKLARLRNDGLPAT